MSRAHASGSSPAFAKVFDEALVQAHERLVRNPADPRAKVAFVTTYHLVIEATLGLTAFEFSTRYLEPARPAAGVRRGLHEDPLRRASPHRLWHLVPADGGGRGPDARRRASSDPARPAPPSGRIARPTRPRPGHRLGRARR